MHAVGNSVHGVRDRDYGRGDRVYGGRNRVHAGLRFSILDGVWFQDGELFRSTGECFSFREGIAKFGFGRVELCC